MRAASASCSGWWKTSTPCRLRARLAKQLLHLVRSYGVPQLADGSEMRIGLQLAQEELAQLLGASRQRVNQELKAMEREEVIRIEPRRPGRAQPRRADAHRRAELTPASPPS